MNKRDRARERFRLIFEMARIKGTEAARGMTPNPMIVSSDTQRWFVSEGACGFAWVTIRPANSPGAHFAKAELGWKTNSYSGGMEFWIHEFGQSIERKEAFAHAFARELNENGIRASAGSRLD